MLKHIFIRPTGQNNTFSLLVIGMISIGIALACGWMPFVKTAENWLSDLRIAEFPKRAEQPSDIVIVSITEETLKQFPYRSPIDRGFLTKLLTKLEEKKARAILLDILFDQPTKEHKDASLKQKLEDIEIPLVVAHAAGQAYTNLTPEQQKHMDTFVPISKQGAATLSTDPIDHTVRWIYPKSEPFKKSDEGLAAKLLRKLWCNDDDKKTPSARCNTLNEYRGSQIAWLGSKTRGESPFTTIPAHCLAPQTKTTCKIENAEDYIKGKIVLIGVDLNSLADRHKTPISVFRLDDDNVTKYPGTPGVVIHAHILSQILDGRQYPTLGTFSFGILVILTTLTGVMVASSGLGIALQIIAGLLLFLGFWICGLVYLPAIANLHLPLIVPTLAFFSATSLTTGYTKHKERVAKENAMKREINAVKGKNIAQQEKLIVTKEKEKETQMKERALRYITPMIQALIKDNPKDKVRVDDKQLVIFFSDIVDFTRKTKDLELFVLERILSDYYDRMTDIAKDNGGVLDKFIGDGVMVYFGYPEDTSLENSVVSCVKMAKEMQSAIQKLIYEWDNEGIEFPFSVRMAIVTGVCRVGDFGGNSEHGFLTHTIIGSDVNLASRIEGKADPGTILICRKTKKYLGRAYVTEEEPRLLELKGFEDKVSAYKII
jgi:adenylate cyclase